METMIRIDVRTIILFYWMTQLFHCSTDIADVCPLTRFCSDRQQEGNISHQSSSCCFPCSCHRNCKLVGTCCHDAAKDESLQYMYPCASQAEIYSKYLSVRYPSPSSPNGRVITDCHNEEAAVSNETISRCRNARYLEDLAFVTGKSSGITYINRHCALCNGEDDVDVWNLRMITRDATVIFSIDASFEARDEYLLRTGSVMSFPPTEFAALSTFCNKYTYSSCNQLENHNQELVDKCNHYNSMYYETETGYFYKNPFCYICNSSPKDTIINKNCGNLAEIVNEGRGGLMDLIVPKFLITSSTTRQTKDTLRTDCNFGETVDVFSGTCTKLLCPPGTVIVGDYCEPLFPDDSGITLVASFSIVFEDLIADIEVERINVSFLKELRKILVSKVKENDRRCDYCRSTINEDLVVSINFKSSPDCSYLKYLHLIAILNKETPIKVFSSYLQKNVSLEGGNITNDNRKRFIADDVRKNVGDCTFTVQVTEDIIPCPSILISMSSFNALSLNQRTRDEIKRIGTDVGNGTLRVCVEEYNKIHTRSSSTGDSNMMTMYILVSINILYTVMSR